MAEDKKARVKGTATEKQTFESALKRLETIVGQMEAGDLSLDDMISRFEEGQKLIALCGAKLNEVERKVEKLVKRGDKLTTVPLDDDAPEAPEEDGEAANFELF